MQHRYAEKFARVIAKRGEIGENVISFSTDSNGNAIVDDNGNLNQWGSDMKIAKGGFINITRIDDMYGISERDFYDTYKFLDEQSEIKMNKRVFVIKVLRYISIILLLLTYLVVTIKK